MNHIPGTLRANVMGLDSESWPGEYFQLREKALYLNFPAQAGERVQWLRELDAFPEDPYSILAPSWQLTAV